MIIALGIAFMIMQIMSIVFFVIILVKLFKNEGALKGILGFIFGIYAFIWGWLKHKELALTKVMVLWSVFTVASIAVVPFIAASGTMNFMSYAAKFAGDSNFKMVNPNGAVSSQNFNLTMGQIKSNAPADAHIKTIQKTDRDTDWCKKAMTLWQNGKYKDPAKAIDYWSRAIRSEQNIATAYNNRGLAYYELKQYRKAIQDYDQAIKLDANYVAAFNNRGNSYYEVADYQQAIADFNQSLKLKPNYSKAHFNRGLVYFQLDSTDQACNDFQAACDHGDCDGIKWANKNEVCQATELMGLQQN